MFYVFPPNGIPEDRVASPVYVTLNADFKCDFHSSEGVVLQVYGSEQELLGKMGGSFSFLNQLLF